jgi:tellurite resistance protein TerC
LHENAVPFINDGKPVPVVEFDTALSLTVIITVLGVTVLASLLSARGKAQAVTSAARRDAVNYLDPHYTADIRERNRIYAKLLEEEQQIRSFGPRHRQQAKDEKELLDLITQAHQQHETTLRQDHATEDRSADPKEDSD